MLRVRATLFERLQVPASHPLRFVHQGANRLVAGERIGKLLERSDVSLLVVYGPAEQVVERQIVQSGKFHRKLGTRRRVAASLELPDNAFDEQILIVHDVVKRGEHVRDVASTIGLGVPHVLRERPLGKGKQFVQSGDGVDLRHNSGSEVHGSRVVAAAWASSVRLPGNKKINSSGSVTNNA